MFSTSNFFCLQIMGLSTMVNDLHFFYVGGFHRDDEFIMTFQAYAIMDYIPLSIEIS